MIKTSQKQHGHGYLLRTLYFIAKEIKIEAGGGDDDNESDN
jgi:hypothetical protein